ncbi:MAG: hypothetical protein U0174_06110 [Polyangiaceae bacterium]
MLERELAVLAYAESKLRDQRVALVGPNTAALGERVLGLGARSVHVFDDHAPRRHERGLVIEGLGGDDFPVRPGAFDAVFVPRFETFSDAPRWLVRFRRMVTEYGLVFVGIPADSRSLSYDHLYDLLSVQFEHIRMVGELPFQGVAMAELGERDEAVDVGIDTQLVSESPEPLRYWAIGSGSAFDVDPYTVLQLDVAPSDAPATPTRDQASRIHGLESELARVRAQLASAVASASPSASLSEELDRLTLELEVRETRLREFATQTQKLTMDVERVSEALRDRDRALLDQEAKHEGHLRTLEEDELKRVRENALLHTLLSEARSELKRRDEALDSLTKEVESKFESQFGDEIENERATEAITEWSLRAETLEARAKELEANLAAQEGEHAREIAELEAKLAELAHAKHAAETAHARATRIATELVSRLDSGGLLAAPIMPISRGLVSDVASGPEAHTALTDKLEHLSGLVARLTGEVEARGWRIAELEQALSVQTQSHTLESEGAGAHS